MASKIETKEASKPKNKYDCSKCPGYCCSYGRIIVSDFDIKRLAKHHGVSEEEARAKFTAKGVDPGERILRHKADPYFRTVCRFLDSKKRRCTIYEARPRVCREYPGDTHCGYYDFLKFERDAQEDPNWISTTDGAA